MRFILDNLDLDRAAIAAEIARQRDEKLLFFFGPAHEAPSVDTAPPFQATWRERIAREASDSVMRVVEDEIRASIGREANLQFTPEESEELDAISREAEAQPIDAGGNARRSALAARDDEIRRAAWGRAWKEAEARLRARPVFRQKGI